MEKPFTGNKDVDRILIENIDDRELFELMNTNSYINSLPNDSFWRNRFQSRYPAVVQYINRRYNLKENYLRTVFFINRLRELYNFNYFKGDPAFIYENLKKYHKSAVKPSSRVLKKWFDDGYEILSMFLDPVLDFDG